MRKSSLCFLIGSAKAKCSTLLPSTILPPKSKLEFMKEQQVNPEWGTFWMIIDLRSQQNVSATKYEERPKCRPRLKKTRGTVT